MTHTFPNTTLLITHYNRSQSLDRLLSSFKKLDVHFSEIVVSDDCSKEDQLNRVQALQKLYNFKLIATRKNGGLGNNINKGQAVITSPYTLYIQEDFVPTPLFPQRFREALTFMEEDRELDLVRFYAYFAYPKMKPYKPGFSEMKFSFWDPDHIKFYMYSDHPHLRRSSFLNKFGNYPEGVDPNKAEFGMVLNFLKKNGKAIFFNEFTTLFDQVNTSDEPSTVDRPDWRLGRNPFIRLARQVYLRFRWLKNTLQLVLKSS
ncbi:glycosyltransferase family A protein [Dyadobacter tibetensis]|uniref:glycosyltransferase family A protein n=1 Tax=Dyadobacter tibetensis TaxID=1211851 RepID=UPI00047059DA|nr:glycosyltransferase family A protein [Dyadobacter tibetensis]